MRNRRLKQIWHNMRYRCYSPNIDVVTARVYRDKGIRICDEWRDEYVAFETWAISHGYANNLTIDRIDPNGDYCPENCRWITKSENSRRVDKRSKVKEREKKQLDCSDTWPEWGIILEIEEGHGWFTFEVLKTHMNYREACLAKKEMAKEQNCEPFRLLKVVRCGRANGEKIRLHISNGFPLEWLQGK